MMITKEREQAYLDHDTSAPICMNCEHFCKHYIYEEEHAQFTEVIFGHCIYKNSKMRKQTDTCDHFARREE